MPIPNGNPQIENGHIDIANELAEALAMINISSYESRVLWIILRKTYGWHKKSDWISLSQFVELTGLKKPHIIRAIKKLVSKNIITQIGNDKGKEYSINKHYKNWKSLPKQATLPKEVTVVTQIGNSSLPKEVPTKETLYKRNSYKRNNTYTRILNFWNSLNIYQHKDIPRLRRKIIAALKIYTPEELEDSMKNYAYILSQPDKFYWTYKWQLKDFLDRGVERFLPINFKEKDYLKRVYKSKAELEEERSTGILSRVFREEEEKDERNKI